MKILRLVFVILVSSFVYGQVCPDPDEFASQDYKYIYQCEGPYLGDAYEAHHLERVDSQSFVINMSVGDQVYPPKEVSLNEDYVYCIGSRSYDGQLDIGIHGYEILEGPQTPRAKTEFIGDFFDESQEQYVFHNALGYKPFWDGVHYLSFLKASTTSGEFLISLDAYRIVESCDAPPQSQCSCPEGTVYLPEEHTILGVPSRLPCQVITKPEEYVDLQCSP